MSAPPRVAIVQRALRRYRERFYTCLRSCLRDEGMALDLYHSTPDPHRDPRDDRIEMGWARRLPKREIPLGSRALIWQPYTEALRRADLVVVEQAADLLLNYRLLVAQTRGATRVGFWGHGRNFRARENDPVEVLKGWVSKRVHWWFPYTERSAEVVAGLGFPRDRMTVVYNSTDTVSQSRDLRAVTEREVEGLRRALGLGAGPVGLFLGMIRGYKRGSYLLEAAVRIRATLPDFHLVIVGGGPGELAIRRQAGRHRFIHPVGPRYGRELAVYLRLADLLLVPGAVGLVVLDSFVAGVPLVTLEDSPHGPEIDYVRHGVNGVLVEAGSGPDRYAGVVVDLLADPARRRRLVQGCLRESRRYTAEGMARRFAAGIRAALAG